MSGKTMSDWEKNARAQGFEEYANSIRTNKDLDMENLKKTGLPQYNWISISFKEFDEKNEFLNSFFKKYIEKNYGFCVRAIPTPEGEEKKHTRKNIKCFFDFEKYKKFLENIVGKDENLFRIIISNWLPSKYGGVIFSGIENGKIIRAEIANDLEKLTSGEINPLASFIYDRKKLGNIEDKTEWLKYDDKIAKDYLWKVFRNYIATGDSFNPFLREGYFEFIITEKEKEIKFVDFKLNEMYLK